MRLIDADALEKVLTDKFKAHYGKSISSGIHDFFRCVVKQISKAPTIEAEPVKHGRWDRSGYCSVCDFWTCYCGDYSYCPNCGAKMDQT